jgi:phage terminase small subunit
MPARKPSALNTRHDTKRDRSARESGENALIPKTQLTREPPAGLKGHKRASATWKRIVGLYFETQGTIITAFDADVLVKYCLAEEELNELFALRAQIKKAWDKHNKWLEKLKPTAENMKLYLSALDQASALLQRFQGMDARLDGKRKLIFTLAQSLYLTPRSRAGVAPPEKEPEELQDEMSKLLDEA